jgi:hypothetical protein
MKHSQTGLPPDPNRGLIRINASFDDQYHLIQNDADVTALLVAAGASPDDLKKYPASYAFGRVDQGEVVELWVGLGAVPYKNQSSVRVI